MGVFNDIFGRSIYKRNGRKISWWFRQHGCLFPFIFLAILITISVALQVKNWLAYIVFLLLLYKVLISFYRLREKTIPVWEYPKNRVQVDTPFFKLNVVLFFLGLVPVAPIVRREELNEGELKIHRRQQMSRLLYHLLLLSFAGAFTFD